MHGSVLHSVSCAPADSKGLGANHVREMNQERFQNDGN